MSVQTTATNYKQLPLLTVEDEPHDVTFTVTVTLPRMLYSALACLYPDEDIAELLVEGAAQRAYDQGRGVNVADYLGGPPG